MFGNVIPNHHCMFGRCEPMGFLVIVLQEEITEVVVIDPRHFPALNVQHRPDVTLGMVLENNARGMGMPFLAVLRGLGVQRPDRCFSATQIQKNKN